MTRTAALLLLLLGLTAHADEAELQGFITNNTISRSGHEFYVRFCERLNDISSLDFNLAIKERPSARWGVLVWVEHENQTLYRRFLQPNVADMKEPAYEAADFVVQEINRRKIEALFEDNIDMAKDEL
ncbi:curli assembly protein CsgE [Stutzerimonas stutzeri ATCC 14405 = CCUG 16156]|uniref:curli production assembly/transport protein CsgE n=1 Tax=Stutzerimonas stutzeri TaxID=316 RepID=UPI00025499D2|nr:curli production assembly/transport protein CsgE [Stutzerimonas stutzeri]MDH2243603.1 curli production assembly/transport protein CsgE [Pseudomonas sp. GD03909]MDH2247020.1 curli production assembly/transport protein CsgE [Pseudomonas sp. GD03856]MDH2267140.1 curli production assembly/transport protein CsgE [Pseudomonas sp. GD03855]EHY76131.1 curli assembly protein CsgE [Stutzerimonas stutzeri ATCC 14405 = CCUG 16156]QOZ96611.1 curli production assembly/transport protein CsgE [Stutzerimonas